MTPAEQEYGDPARVGDLFGESPAEYRERKRWQIPICKMSDQPVETDLDHDGNVVCDECAGEVEWVEVVPADDKRAMERDIVEQEEVFSRARAVAEERERVLVEALKRYGTHRVECAMNTVPPNRGPCDCGWDAALDSVQEGERA